MNMIPVDVSTIANPYFNARGSNQRLLEDFIDSGLECVRLEGWTHRNAYGCAASISNAIKRERIGTVIVAVRKGEVYLIRKHIK